jgi:hypothetical protein
MAKVGAAFEVLAQVAQASGKAKQEILLRAKRNAVLRQLMQRCYDQHENYYLTEVPAAVLRKAHKTTSKTASEAKLTARFKEFNQLLDALNGRTVTGNAAKEVVADFFTAGLTPAEINWYARVLKRHLDIGVQAKTLLKIWPLPNTAGARGPKIQYRGCYLCHPLDPKRPLQFPLQVDPKLDGLRFTDVSADGDSGAFTRGGYRYATMQHIEQRLAQLAAGVFDFEGLSKNWNQSSSLAKRGKRGPGGMFLATAEEVEEARKKVYAWIFDYILYDDYMRNAGTAVPLCQRRWQLLRVIGGYLVKHAKLLRPRHDENDARHARELGAQRASQLRDTLRGIKQLTLDDAGKKRCRRLEQAAITLINTARWKLRVVPWRWVNSMQEINAYYRECLDNGFEGCMVKAAGGGWWATRRGREWGKIKPEEDITMEIVGYEEGAGKCEGMLGAFVCKYKGRTVNVGGKMSDAQRKLFWKERKSLIGRKIDVLVQARDATADIIACFPRFARFRDDL